MGSDCPLARDIFSMRVEPQCTFLYLAGINGSRGERIGLVRIIFKWFNDEA